MKYLITCVAGLQDVAWRSLHGAYDGLRLARKEEGLLLCAGPVRPQQLCAARYLNNCYEVLAELGPIEGLSEALKTLATPQYVARCRRTAHRARTFRLVLSDNNQLVSGSRETAALVAAVQRQTGLAHAPRGGDTEFWVMRRRSGHVYLCRRLSRRSRTEKTLQPGELRPAVAHLLCLLSQPERDDVFADPFAGSGAIAFARACYRYNIVFASDISEPHVRAMKERARGDKNIRAQKRSPFIVHNCDARKLHRFRSGFVNKVVTDPPWGQFDRSLEDPGTFYGETFVELCRITKPGGMVVVLLGDRALADEIARTFETQLTPLETFNVLISGKKAVVRKWARTAAE